MDEYIEIINPGDPVDPCYGLEKIDIKLEHINALLNGKQIYITVNGAEYAIILKLNREDKG